MLTSIRGLAAWWVVFYHVRALFAPHIDAVTMAVFRHGYLAVDMFFVLSGFVIYLNYVDRMQRTVASVSDFLVRRLARIYPLHFVMTLVVVPYALTLQITNGEVPRALRWELLPLNLLLVQTWGFVNQLSWNIPAWSISTELFAYMLFPAIVLLTDWRRWPTWGLVALIGVLALALHLIVLAIGVDNFGYRVSRTGLPRCVIQFVIGTLVCALYLRLRRSERRAALSLLLIGLAVLLGVGTGLGHLPVAIGLPPLWAALILGLALWPATWRNPLRWRALVYLGDISYATYLCHFVALIPFKQLLVENEASTPLPILLLYVGGVALASVLLYHGVERPSQRWILDRWRQWRQRRLAIAGG